MSLTWRQRLRMAKKRMMEKLDLTEADWQEIWDNIGDYCSESDSQLKVVYGDERDTDELAERQSEYDFEQMTADIIEKVMKKLGYIKEKEKKKKKKAKRKAEDGQTGKETEEVTTDESEEQLEEEVAEQEQEITA